MTRRLVVFASLMLCLAFSLCAGATTVTFTAPCSTCYAYYSPTYTDAGTGTTFTIASGGIDLTGKDYYGAGTYPADFLIGASDAYSVANLLTIALPGTYKSVGIDLGSFSGGQFTVTLSDGSAYAVNPPSPYNLNFYTFTSSVGISSLTISTPANDTFVIDKLTFGAVPEPGSVALLSGGGLALFGTLRRRFLG